MTPRQLARVLEPFGVTPANIRDVGKVVKGYTRDRLADAFHRYLPLNNPLRRYTRPNTTVLPGPCPLHPGPIVADAADPKPAGNGHCSGVAGSFTVAGGGSLLTDDDRALVAGDIWGSVR